jgi:DNA-binding NarL/FixJ family response regulator
MAPIRILMADDHKIFREGFAAMFAGNREIELLDMAADGRFLLSMVEKHRPDVVLTDIQMEPVDGFEVTRQMAKRYSEIPVIALSMYEDNYSIIEMLRAGARGYLVKNAGKEMVMEAIKAANRGESYYCRTASRKISALIASGRYDPSEQQGEFNPTELRILQLLCEDYDSKEIAEKMNISLVMINRYRMQLLEKVGVKTATALVFFAVKNGLVRW